MVALTIVWSDEFNLFGAVGDEDQCFWHRVSNQAEMA
jgi:hypothetical protein